ncbi:transporter, CPA2 family [Aedoeadaptatus nemausensis]|uniref:Transporter, CPA2 family n=1 Tax=Aedoeadaptatus nemausensis TaxID=2582829 RepID=A0A6V6Y7L4_9FIRM|nr:cation:proton antiporter [Peptoniphilus nemausensis]CAC9936018.1 transporter, CPA2 family [Peptoniphilus nemausensis]
MLLSLALLLLMGLGMKSLVEKMGLPGIIGIFATGVLLGPSCFNLLDDHLLAISGELRQMALIIILLKAGLSLDLSDLKKVGRPAIFVSFVPASFEIIGYTLLAPMLLGISRVDAALMGTVLAAVSPAVVVPRMAKMMEEGVGTERSVPQLIMAGASCDDIFVIVLFTSFLGMVKGGDLKLASLMNVPLSVICGMILGEIVGYVLYRFFESAFVRERHVRNSVKVLVMLAVSFLLVAGEELLKGKVPVSGLIAVVAMAVVIHEKMPENVSSRLSEKFGKLWIGAEIFLFVLVGAAVDIHYTMEAGGAAVALIFMALIFRSFGVALSLAGTHLNLKERLFCIFAYLPKATVQAAIGSVPLQAGLSSGNMILSVAVLSILTTAPIGALLIDRTQKSLLSSK